MRPSQDEWAMSVALITAKRSTCLRRQVGCVLLNARGHVLSTGYNGVAAGLPHCNEITGEVPNPALKQPDGTYRSAEHWERETVPVFGCACAGARSSSGTDLDSCQAIHAEQNALLQCRDMYEIHTAYTTTSPCVTCCKLLLNTSCQRIVFIDQYAKDSSKLWTGAGRIWDHYEVV